MSWLALLLAVEAFGGVTVTLPATDREVVFEDDVSPLVTEAMAALSERRFEDAGRLFATLADASRSADLRYLEAVAWYEAGQLRMAERAVRDGVERAPDHGALLSLHGLVQADLGQGDAALAALSRAEAAAGGDAALLARIRLNRGLVELDRGRAADAERLFTQARDGGRAIGATDVVAAAEENLALVAALRGAPAGGDALGQVAERLRRGDVKGAKAAVAAGTPVDRRDRIRRLLAEAAIARAEGRLEPSLKTLDEAIALAREGGLVREHSAALAQRGVVNALLGRYGPALDELQQAIGMVAGSSFRVNEVAWRVEAGKVAVRAEDLGQARAQLQAARAASAGVEDPLGAARLAELDGAIAARGDDPQAAAAAFERAIVEYEKRQYWAEAARVATDVVEVWAGRDEAKLAKAEERAAALFAKAGDPVGPAHVSIAEGLGRARRKDLDGALRAFASAATAAEAVATDRGRQVSAIAREDAAQLLLAMGHSADAVAKASEWGLEKAVARHERFVAAEQAYSQALGAYNAGRFTDARAGFDTAYRTFTEIGEHGYARTSRRGRAWSEYNAHVAADPARQFEVYTRLIEEAAVVQDPELRARSMAASALASATLGRGEAGAALRGAARAAEQMGLHSVAGQCFAELAQRDGDLNQRTEAARRAYELRGDRVGVYAMYSVAVDAYNAGAYDVAIELADEAMPNAGDLAASLTQVRDAARGAAAE